MLRLTIQVLGASTVQLDSKPLVLTVRKALALLLYLAVTDRPQRRDFLATLFWPEQNQRKARAYLRQTLWTLRSTLGEEWLHATGETIALASPATRQLDLAEFNKVIAVGVASSSPTALSLLERAVAYYQGDFLAGFTLDDSPAFDDLYILAHILTKLGLSLAPLGYPDRALQQAQEGLAQEQAHYFGVVHCRGIMAFVHLLRGEYQPALHCCEVAKDLLETYEFPQLRTMVGQQHSVALTGVGQTAAGLALLRQVIAEREANNSPRGNYTSQAMMTVA